MRGVLILMTIGSLLANLLGGTLYFRLISGPDSTILQEIEGLMQVGISGLCLTIGVASLAIIQAIRALPGATAGEPASKARWWQDKNNPGNE